MMKTQWRKRACYTDLVREKVGRPWYLFHAHFQPRRSPRHLSYQQWFSGSKCSPTCYLSLLSTGGEDKKEGREIKEKGQSKLVLFVKILLCLLPIWVCSIILLLLLLSTCLMSPIPIILNKLLICDISLYLSLTNKNLLVKIISCALIFNLPNIPTSFWHYHIFQKDD